MVGVVKEPKVALSKQADVMPTSSPKPEVTTEQEEEPTPKQTCGTLTPMPSLNQKQGGKKLPKKESLALINKTNMKITGWIKTDIRKKGI